MCKNHAILEQRMSEVVDYSVEHVKNGGIPFTAYVIDDEGNILGQGVNRVMENSDPTAHAEVEAIRDACKNTQSPHLRGLTLLASGEPCAMCYLNAMYSGIGKVLFAADSNEAAVHGFDYRRTYSMLADFPSRWPMEIAKHQVEGSLEPFKMLLEKRNLG
ncbi:nucleoside deaminase [Alteromonas sp. a30]|uniref:nucleoside deaminase n=1 Tax=Alteromonas sp. a30 TaxID=2730917 RepID=UPI00227E5CB3|nr:nucleoside deaminase [Alteromonas sp. a30]MCY7294991.1 nucleoside deaminase [Alteromonas sp. a30]